MSILVLLVNKMKSLKVCALENWASTKEKLESKREKWESMLEKLESTEGIQEYTGDWMLHNLEKLVSMTERWGNI